MLPHREEVKEAIEHSLDMLHQLSTTTKLASSSHSFLQKLVQATPELAGYGATKKRRTGGIPPTAELANVPAPVSASAKVNVDIRTGDADQRIQSPMTTHPDQFSFDLDNFLANNPFGELSSSASFDMGGMEQIWDYDNLHLDGLSTNEPLV